MTHKIIEDMKWRYACKKFDPSKKLSEEEVNALLESLRLTASSYGLQPWKFLLINNPKLREELVGAAFGQVQVKEASHLIILCGKADIEEPHVDAYLEDIVQSRNVTLESLEKYKGMLMKHIVEKMPEEKSVWTTNQIYIALGTLLSACAHMRIDSCPMEGFKPSAVDQILGLKERGLRSILLCPVGHRADDDTYTERLKVRFSKEEVVEIFD